MKLKFFIYSAILFLINVPIFPKDNKDIIELFLNLNSNIKRDAWNNNLGPIHYVDYHFDKVKNSFDLEFCQYRDNHGKEGIISEIDAVNNYLSISDSCGSASHQKITSEMKLININNKESIVFLAVSYFQIYDSKDHFILAYRKKGDTFIPVQISFFIKDSDVGLFFDSKDISKSILKDLNKYNYPAKPQIHYKLNKNNNFIDVFIDIWSVNLCEIENITEGILCSNNEKTSELVEEFLKKRKYKLTYKWDNKKGKFLFYKKSIFDYK
jgi:hypothetical protein